MRKYIAEIIPQASKDSKPHVATTFAFFVRETIIAGVADICSVFERCQGDTLICPDATALELLSQTPEIVLDSKKLPGLLKILQKVWDQEKLTV